MKKIVIIILSMLALVANAQKVVTDMVKDGGRLVATDQVRATGITEKVKQWYAVTGFQLLENGRTGYSLAVKTNWNQPFCIEKGMKLLLKNNNDEVIILEAEQTVDVKHGELLSASATLLVYSGTAYYTLTDEDVVKIAAGIKKVRIETTTEAVDKEFSSDKIGKFIAKGYQHIKQTLSSKKADITDGF